MNKKIKNIVFDFDGVIHNTLLDLYKIHCEYLEEISLEDMVKNVFEKNPRKYLEKFSKEKRDKFNFAWTKCSTQLKLEDNIRKNLEYLADKFDLFIISSNSEENLNLYFKNNNFTNIFKEILGVETHKLKTEKFKFLLNKYNLEKENCIFITDTLGDILEANEVEIKTIAVDFGFHSREFLSKGNPFKIVSSFQEIILEIEKI